MKTDKEKIAAMKVFRSCRRAGACSRRNKQYGIHLIWEDAEQQMLSLEDRYTYLSVEQYVITPNRIRVVFALERRREQAPALRSQTSFEHIIRGREDYEEIVKYIIQKDCRATAIIARSPIFIFIG